MFSMTMLAGLICKVYHPLIYQWALADALGKDKGEAAGVGLLAPSALDQLHQALPLALPWAPHLRPCARTLGYQ